MFGIKKKDFYATPDQEKWDKKSNEQALMSNILAGVWAGVFLIPAIGILISKFSQLSNRGSSGYLAARNELIQTSGPIIFSCLAMIVIGLLLAIPLNRYIDRSKAALGIRPADASYKLTNERYMNRVIKHIPLTITKMNSEVNFFRVPPLYGQGPSYSFKIERLTRKQRFYEDEYIYRITENDNKFSMNITVEDSTFYGMCENQIVWCFSQYISCALEDNTDYFKAPVMELSYVI